MVHENLLNLHKSAKITSLDLGMSFEIWNFVSSLVFQAPSGWHLLRKNATDNKKKPSGGLTFSFCSVYFTFLPPTCMVLTYLPEEYIYPFYQKNRMCLLFGWLVTTLNQEVIHLFFDSASFPSKIDEYCEQTQTILKTVHSALFLNFTLFHSTELQNTFHNPKLLASNYTPWN